MPMAIAAAALAVGYLIGRLRPWAAFVVWAEDEVRFLGPWARGNRIQQAAVLLAHCATHPRHSWASLRKRR